MAYNKIFFHLGPGGNAQGLGQMIDTLDARGIPVCVKSADHAGPVYELAQHTGVQHVPVFRLSSAGQNDGYNYDIPPYHLSPADAAREHWARHRAKMPPELFGRDVWVEAMNEPNKDMSDWLGHFAAEIAPLILDDGFRFSAFGFSGGEPEPEHWRTTGMRRYLLLAQNDPRLSVSLHEYSCIQPGAPLHLMYGYPSLVGRFWGLFAACDEANIGRPRVIITEFGWGAWSAPLHDQVISGPGLPSMTGMQQVEWAASEYAKSDHVLGVATWYLGGGYSGIADKVQPYIAPVTSMTANTVFPPGPGPGPAPSPKQAIWDDTVREQVAHGIRLNPAAAIQREIFSDGFVPVINEIQSNGYTAQAAENLSSGERRVYIWSPSHGVSWFGDPQSS